MPESKTPPTTQEMLAALEVLDKLDGSKLLTEDEETALAVVSDALVALTDPMKDAAAYRPELSHAAERVN